MSQFNLQKAIELAEGETPAIIGGTGLYINDPIILTENYYPYAIELERSVGIAALQLYGFADTDVKDAVTRKAGNYVIHAFQFEYENYQEELKKSQLYFDISLAYSNKEKRLQEVKTPEEYSKLISNQPQAKKPRIKHFAQAVRAALQDEEALEEFYCYIIEDDEISERAIEAGLRECGARESMGMIRLYLEHIANAVSGQGELG
jgi:hypothetical protein